MKTQSIALSLFLLVAIAMTSSCKTVDDGPTPPTGDTYTSFNQLIDENKVAPHVITVDPEENIEFEGPRGTVVRIPGNSLVDQNGNPVTGSVQVSLREFYNRRDIVMSGINTNANNDMLVTGGAIELTAEQGGSPLKLATGRGIVAAFPAVNTANQITGFENDMRLFTSDGDPQDPNGNFNWQMANAEPARLDSSSSGLNSFILMDLQLGWSNCDALYTIPAVDRTQFEVEVTYPVINNSTSSGEVQVFMLVKDLSTVINLFTRNGPAFATYANSVPTGLEATLVAIAIVDDQLYFGSEKIIVAGDDSFTLDVSPGSTAALESLLDNPF